MAGTGKNPAQIVINLLHDSLPLDKALDNIAPLRQVGSSDNSACVVKHPELGEVGGEVAKASNHQRGAKQTLTDTLFYVSDPQKRAEIDEFRTQYEVRHGLTDLTKRYTSQWPTKQQQWLFEHDQQRWFDGLPDFTRAFFKQKIEQAWTKPQPESYKPRHWIEEFMESRVRCPEDTSRGR